MDAYRLTLFRLQLGWAIFYKLYMFWGKI